MTDTTLKNVEVGSELPAITKAPISRTTLALFAGASGDHNPMHIDIDFAKKAGAPDVFAQGMLSMAYLGQLLTNWAPQSAIRKYGVRFGAITHLGDKISCQGKVTEIVEVDGERRAKLDLVAANQDGDVKLQGTAEICID